MTLVLSAFNGEIAACIGALQDKKKSKIFLGVNTDIHYTSGVTAEGEPVVAAVTGIGKINSYISTFELISECSPDRVIFVGIAGAVDPELRIGDIVLSDTIVQYDMDYWAAKVMPGGSSGPMKSLIRTDENITAKIVTVVRDLQKRGDFQRTLAVGCTGSADIYMTPELQGRYADVLTRRDVLAVDMEGFSSAAAALMRQIPFAQIRIISDEADGTKPVSSGFREFVRSASRDLASIIVEMRPYTVPNEKSPVIL